jgi:hypothetical protein
MVNSFPVSERFIPSPYNRKFGVFTKAKKKRELGSLVKPLVE